MNQHRSLVWVSERLRHRRFAFGVSMIAFAGLSLRLVFAFSLGPVTGGDAQWYSNGAIALSGGNGFVHPTFFKFWGDTSQSFFKPPLWTSVLAIPSRIFPGDPVLFQRIVACLIGALTIVVIGYLARKVLGERAGFFAAGLAAVYPNLVVLDGLLLVECLYALTIALVLLISYRLLERRDISSAVLLGVVIGFAALERTDALALLPVLVIPVAWRLKRQGTRVFGLVSTVLVGVAAAVVPWSVYASATAGEVVPISSNSGAALVNANCPETWFGQGAGYWSITCELLPEKEHGVAYASSHLFSYPRVAMQRVGRTFDFYQPQQNAQFSSLIDGRSVSLSRLGRVTWWLSIPVAVFGALVCRRRKVWIWPLLSTVVFAVGVSVVIHGETRFRIPAEISVVVLCGIGLSRISVLRQQPAGATGTESIPLR